jgi:hypothetical protein
MEFNFISIIVAAFIPMVVGFIYYHPKVMGTAWMKVASMTEEKIRSGNMAVTFGVSFVLSLLLALAVTFAVIHQYHVYSVLANEPGIDDAGSEIGMWLADFMGKYGDNFRTFKHGALHGFISGLFFAVPVLGTNALFEQKGFKYIAVNGLYWIITITLMGGVICAWQ